MYVNNFNQKFEYTRLRDYTEIIKKRRAIDFLIKKKKVSSDKKVHILILKESLRNASVEYFLSPFFLGILDDRNNSSISIANNSFSRHFFSPFLPPSHAPRPVFFTFLLPSSPT